jgi:hypothetical protein
MSCEVFNESDIAMVEGCQQTFEINLYNILGEEVNAAINMVEWRMSRYGETECLLSKSYPGDDSISLASDSVITINLLSDETQNMFGKFTHQAIITDVGNHVFVVDLGKISIKPMIK